MAHLTGDLETVLSADCVKAHPLALKRVAIGLALLVVHLLARLGLLEDFFPDLLEGRPSMGHREGLSVTGHPEGHLLMDHAEVHL